LTGLSGEYFAVKKRRKDNDMAEQRLAAKRVPTEKELERKKRHHELALRAANAGSWDWDIVAGNLSWSDTIEAMFGFSRGEFAGTYEAFLNCVHPEDRPHVVEAVNACLDQGRKYDIEHRIVWPDGSVRWVSETGDIIQDEDRRPVRMLGVVKDITHRQAIQEELRKARDELEKRVEERTEQLSKANKKLRHQIEKQKRTESRIRLDEARLEAIYQLGHMSPASVAELAGFALDQGIKLTGSEVGFLGLLSEDESTYTLHAVSKDVMPVCKVAGDPVHWEVAEAGVWADAIRRRKTLIVDDYSQPHPSKRGMPEGHFALHRFMVVPLLDAKRIVAVVGVGNKTSSYNKTDDRQLSLLLEGMWRYIQRNRAQELLLASSERLRLLPQKLAEAQELERKRIAQELHDSVAGKLTAIKYGVEKALAELDSDKLPTGISLKDVVSMVQGAIQETRRISARLRPVGLDDLGLLNTITAFCREFDMIYSDIRVQEQFDLEENEIPEPLKIVIYRILQEALNNVAKHSRAKAVHVSLRKTGGKIELAIEDDGHGFDPEEVSCRNEDEYGMGLSGMQERAELSAGSFEILSTLGKGTTIRVLWPVGD
jgi:PAS domain S-box-containing protein